MTKRRSVFVVPEGYQPTAGEKRVMSHILKAFSDEVAVLSQDGMKPRAVVIGLLMSAVKLTSSTGAFPPADLRGMFDAIVDRYTETEEGPDA